MRCARVALHLAYVRTEPLEVSTRDLAINGCARAAVAWATRRVAGAATVALAAFALQAAVVAARPNYLGVSLVWSALAGSAPSGAWPAVARRDATALRARGALGGSRRERSPRTSSRPPPPPPRAAQPRPTAGRAVARPAARPYGASSRRPRSSTAASRRGAARASRRRGGPAPPTTTSSSAAAPRAASPRARSQRRRVDRAPRAGAAPDERFFDVPALARPPRRPSFFLARAPTPPPPQAMHVYGTPHHWDLRTAPEPEPVPELATRDGARGRELLQCRGKCLGGCSAVGYTLYARGHPADFDGWGVPGWRYADLEPDFAAVEARLPLRAPRHRTRGGDAFASACEAALGARGPTARARRQKRLRPALVTVDGLGSARHRADAFLERRANLDVVTRGPAPPRRPALLLLSGVGDAAALAKVGVAPRVHLPNVGRNLRDFAGTGLVVRARDDGWDRRSQSLAGLAAYGAAGAGPLSATSQEVQCVHGGGGGAAPKYEFFYQAMAFPFAHRTSYDDHVAAVRAGALPRAFTVHCCLLKPRSAGAVTLASNDAFAPPTIAHGYLADPRDLADLVAALRLARAVVAATGLSGEEAEPGAAAASDGDLEAYVRRSFCHFAGSLVGTCRMGDDAGAVRAAAVPIEPAFFGTLTGILFFDAPAKAEIPKGPLRPNLKTMVVFDSFNETRSRVPTVAPVGTAVAVDYALFRGGFDGRPTERGALAFTVGDGSVNPALDELVRTLGPSTLRRATVPASSDLDRSGDASKPT
ncbi:hypothetical protein JL721_12267 [Aureococcus anophagefferens]|nr:hypothetical protein JL721_12267 [Aureococcus anophagefferens]